jgi:hypothetical protein
MYKLGKLPARHDKRALCLADYIGNLPPPPDVCDWGKKVLDWPMMKNDDIGDCTIAGAGHLQQLWTTNLGIPIVPTDAQVVSAYSEISGYNPVTGENDNGAALIDVLNTWRTSGLFNHKIEAFTSLEPKNHNHVMQAIDLFGGIYLGFELPKSVEDKNIWSVPPQGPVGQGAPGSLGGHCVVAGAYNHNYIFVISWGMVIPVTWNFWNIYCDESYAILSPDWINNKDIAPSGFDLASLQKDLKAVTN